MALHSRAILFPLQPIKSSAAPIRLNSPVQCSQYFCLKDSFFGLTYGLFNDAVSSLDASSDGRKINEEGTGDNVEGSFMQSLGQLVTNSLDSEDGEIEIPQIAHSQQRKPHGVCSN
jgi:hypothetical protein